MPVSAYALAHVGRAAPRRARSSPTAPRRACARRPPRGSRTAPAGTASRRRPRTVLDRALRIDDPAERRQRHAQRDAVLGQHLLRGDLDRLRTQVEALDLDLAVDRPEGVPARREPLHEPALDVEQARLVVLDHGLGDVDVALAREHREVARRDLRLARHVDALDLDAGRDLPEHARLPRTHQVRTGRPSRLTMATSSALRLDRLEHLSREIRPRRLEHGVALRREFGAHDLVQLDRKRRAAGRTDGGGPGSSTRSNRPLRVRKARSPSFTVTTQHQQVPVHGTSPSLAFRRLPAQAWLRASRMWVPDAASRGTGGPGLEPAQGDGRTHPPAREARRPNGGPGTLRGRYPPRRRAGLTVSWCGEKEPFGRSTGPRLKRASGPLHWVKSA